MVSQPQNPEFRNNPENFYHCTWATSHECLPLLKAFTFSSVTDNCPTKSGGSL